MRFVRFVLYKRIAGLGSALKKHSSLSLSIGSRWPKSCWLWPVTGSCRKVEDESDIKCGDSEHVSDSSTSSETSRSSSFSSVASNENLKRAKGGKKKKTRRRLAGFFRHIWDDWNEKAQEESDYKGRNGKQKSTGNHGKAMNLSLSEEPENKTSVFTALVGMDKNGSRIRVFISLASSCATSFAAFKGKLLEACVLSCLKNVQFFYLHNDLRV